MLQADILKKFPSLWHCFGEKNDGINSKEIPKYYKNILTKQIHGNIVRAVNKNSEKIITNCDGLITKEKGLILIIKTADCLPIIFYEKETEIISIIHAGWKGLLNGIIKETLDAFQKLGVDRSTVIAVIGPHIRKCCYQVYLDRMKLFPKDFPNIPKIQNGKKYHLDMEKIALRQFTENGITRANTQIIKKCTSCLSNFHSYRRDGDKAGRMYNMIGLLN